MMVEHPPTDIKPLSLCLSIYIHICLFTPPFVSSIADNSIS